MKNFQPHKLTTNWLSIYWAEPRPTARRATISVDSHFTLAINLSSISKLLTGKAKWNNTLRKQKASRARLKHPRLCRLNTKLYLRHRLTRFVLSLESAPTLSVCWFPTPLCAQTSRRSTLLAELSMICYHFMRPLQYVPQEVLRIPKPALKKQQKLSSKKVNRKISQRGMQNYVTRM